MNERILELARIASGKETVGASDMGDWGVTEIFAKLIVYECVTILYEQERKSPGNWAPQHALTHEYAIKKHFGMTE